MGILSALREQEERLCALIGLDPTNVLHATVVDGKSARVTFWDGIDDRDHRRVVTYSLPDGWQCSLGDHSWVETTTYADDQREYVCLRCPSVRHERR